jgi:hypothetical protein
MYAQPPDKDGIRRSRWAVVSNTRPQLRDTARRTFDAWLGQFGRWRENPTEFKIRTKTVECEVLFRALDTPKDVRNLLSLELTGAYFNEVREIAREIWDGMDARVGRFPDKKSGPGALFYGMWADSNPWHDGHWCDKLFTSGLEGYELFRQPDGLGPEAENLANLPGYTPENPHAYYVDMCAGKTKEWIDVYVRGLNAVVDEGSVFGKWLQMLRERGGVSEFGHRVDDVFTSWDLGLADSTAIFWWRVTPNGVEVLDWYENQGEDLEHYFEEIEGRALPVGKMLRRADGTCVYGKGWDYVKHWLPHDSNQKTLAAGTSVMNRFLQRKGIGASKVSLNPDLTVADGIEAARWLLQQKGTRFHARAQGAIERLQEYRFAWDDKKVCFSKVPIHNGASHSGDALRYVAIVARHTGLIMSKPKGPDKVEVGGIQLVVPQADRPQPKGYVSAEGKINYSLNDLFKLSRR